MNEDFECKSPLLTYVCYFKNQGDLCPYWTDVRFLWWAAALVAFQLPSELPGLALTSFSVRQAAALVAQSPRSEWRPWHGTDTRGA